MSRADPAWTPEHRRRVGQLIDDEMKRRGKRPDAVATELGVVTRTITRVCAGEASPATLRRVADHLGLSENLVLPPRPEAERTQLDRIEAMLRALLAHAGITPDESPGDVAETGAQRLEGTRAEGAPSRPGRKRKGQEA